jgi:ABC-type proline/glycine betaine transport system permease subunit
MLFVLQLSTFLFDEKISNTVIKYISQFRRIPSIALSLLTVPVLESVVLMKTGLQNSAFMLYLLRILIWHQPAS